MNPKQKIRENVLLQSYLRRKHLVDWIKNGYPKPLPSVMKQDAVLYHAVARELDVLVETGTYLGDMVFAQIPYFRRIYTIELSKELYDRAKRRFSGRPNVSVLHGDSSERLKDVVNGLDSAALFWLDGHYSGGVTAKGQTGCPIFAELQYVFASPFTHTILIDDARLFDGTDDYPTFEELRDYVEGQSAYRIRPENDMFILNRPDSI
jgi:hypothetical protein